MCLFSSRVSRFAFLLCLKRKGSRLFRHHNWLWHINRLLLEQIYFVVKEWLRREDSGLWVFQIVRTYSTQKRFGVNRVCRQYIPRHTPLKQSVARLMCLVRISTCAISILPPLLDVLVLSFFKTVIAGCILIACGCHRRVVAPYAIRIEKNVRLCSFASLAG